MSARALGVLLHLSTQGSSGGAKGLSEGFKEGREAFQSTLTELTALGFIETKTYRQTNGTFCRQIVVTDAGFQELVNRVRVSSTSIQLSPLYSLLADYSNSLNTNTVIATKSTDEVREEEFSKVDIGIGAHMTWFGTPMDPDDVADLKAKDKARKQKEYEEAKAEKAQKAFVHRDKKDPANWTVSDSASYFASLVPDQWNMPPWRIHQSRFIMALSTFRKNNDSDGTLEKVLMERFFSSLTHEQSLDDPEKLWKQFIVRAPGMVADAKRAMITDDDMVTAKIKYKSSMEKFNVQD